MSTSELFKKARKIELASRRLIEEELAGQYESVFKGRGLVFSDVRPYIAGDDIRAIDWNVSARMGAPHIKQFVEERDRTVYLAIDVSASHAFGSRQTTKRTLAAELAAVVAFAAIQNNDRVGLAMCTDHVERFVPAKKGRRHVLRVVSEILTWQPQSRGTDLAAVLTFLGKVSRRRSVVFLVSDFLSTNWEHAMRVAAQRHDVVPVVVEDPLERALPEVGLLQLEDLESGQVHELDTSGGSGAALRRAAIERAAERDRALRRMNLETVAVRTDQPYVDALVAFFRARARRLSHG